MNSAVEITVSKQTEPGVSRSKGRWQLIFILALVIGPMLLATAMYYGKFWVPDGRSYHGEFLGGSATSADLGVLDDQVQGWQLLVSAPQACEDACQKLVYLARQVHIGLGREASRASHALAIGTKLPESFAAQLEQEYPQLQQYSLDVNVYQQLQPNNAEPQLWIVDPHGNLVLRYSAADKGKQILLDLRHLLKLSNIG